MSDLPDLWVSPTQYDTFKNVCRRKWWFKWPHRIPTPQSKYARRGTVLHEVVERYLKAERDLYPEGWAKGLTPEDAAIVRRLVDEAIAQGVLYRPPEFLVEHEYTHEFLLESGVTVKERGFIDLLLTQEIIDHKTHGRREYALSEAKLEKAIQMRCYAAELRRIRRAQEYEDVPIRVTHNNYICDPKKPKTFAHSALVTPEDLEQHQKEMQSIAQQMVDMRDLPLYDWEKIEVEEQLAVTDGCQAYGGCNMRGICSGGQDPVQYRAMMREAEAARTSIQGEGEKPMGSLLDRMRKPNTNTSAPAPAGAAATKPPPAQPYTEPVQINPPAVEITPDLADVSDVDLEGLLLDLASDAAPQTKPLEAPPAEQIVLRAPWAHPGCVACEGKGFDTRGAPCRACDAGARRAGRPTSAEYRQVEGRWVLPGSVLPPSDDTPQMREDAQAPDEAKGRTVGEAIVGEIQKAVDAGELPTIPRRGRKPGSKNKPKEGVGAEATREAIDTLGKATIADLAEANLGATLRLAGALEPKGFVLVINAHVRDLAPAGIAVIDFWTFYNGLCEIMAKEQGKEHFCELDPFRRRDGFTMNARSIAQQLAGHWVVAHRVEDPDSRALLSALRPLADVVVEA